MRPHGIHFSMREVSSPAMAQEFRAVTYDNLPRYIHIPWSILIFGLRELTWFDNKMVYWWFVWYRTILYSISLSIYTHTIHSIYNNGIQSYPMVIWESMVSNLIKRWSGHKRKVNQLDGKCGNSRGIFAHRHIYLFPAHNLYNFWA